LHPFAQLRLRQRDKLRRDAIRQVQFVGHLARHGHAARAAAPDKYRQVVPVRFPGKGVAFRRREDLARKGGCLPGQKAPDEQHGLTQRLEMPPVGNAQLVELPEIALAEPEQRPPLAVLVQECDHLGRQGRMAAVGVRHAGS